MNALFSLWYKTGLAQVVPALTAIDPDWQFYASSGTAAQISAAGFNATDLATKVGAPSPDHLVVTLSAIHFGILCNRQNVDHMDYLQLSGLPYIDLVWVSLYDTKKVIKDGGDEAAVIKATDMGGVALLRSGAKGRRLVAGSPPHIRRIIQHLRDGSPDDVRFRRWLAGEAEAIAASYCRQSKAHIRTLNAGYQPPAPARLV